MIMCLFIITLGMLKRQCFFSFSFLNSLVWIHVAMAIEEKTSGFLSIKNMTNRKWHWTFTIHYIEVWKEIC